jgi:hypothetical protein
MAQFNHFELSLLNPSFDSPLVDALTELELLRHLRLETDVHPILFAQLKAVFHMLESLGSARIEETTPRLPTMLKAKLKGRRVRRTSSKKSIILKPRWSISTNT